MLRSMNAVGGEWRALSHDEGPGSNSHSITMSVSAPQHVWEPRFRGSVICL